MSEHVWYFLKESFAGESQEGPLTEPQFIQLVKKGALKKSTKICSPTRTKGQWTTVEQVPSIFALIEQGKQERAQEKAAQPVPQQPVQPAETAAPSPVPTPPRFNPTPSPVAQEQPLKSAAPTPAPVAEAGPYAFSNVPQFQPRQYPGLSIVRFIAFALAVLQILGMIGGLIVYLVVVMNDPSGMAGYAMLGPMAGGLVASLFSMLALVFLANLIKLLIDVQTNTQFTAFLTSRMYDRQ